MGFHLCPFCTPTSVRKYSNSSSGDVILGFASGRDYEMPDMILHYIGDHGYLPSAIFVEDVMGGKLVIATRLQTKGIVQEIGYLELEGDFQKGEVPSGFVEKLEQMMLGAVSAEDRERYREMLHD